MLGRKVMVLCNHEIVLNFMGRIISSIIYLDIVHRQKSLTSVTSKVEKYRMKFLGIQEVR